MAALPACQGEQTSARQITSIYINNRFRGWSSIEARVEDRFLAATDAIEGQKHTAEGDRTTSHSVLAAALIFSLSSL